jgi:hypothetical protein
MSKEQKIVYLRETTSQSMISDLFSFGTIVAAFWFNYRFIGGNDALDVVLGIAFFMFSIGRAANYKKLKELEKDD